MSINIKNLATKPVLVKVTLDDPEIVSNYGDALEFWVWDKQPLTKFIKFANAEQSNPAELIDFCSTLILDEAGNPVMTDGAILPATVLIKCVNRVVEQLGK